MYLHPYALRDYNVPALAQYMNCTDPYLSDRADSCHCHLKKICGKRFREPKGIQNMDFCKKILSNTDNQTSISNTDNHTSLGCFDKYSQCINDHWRPLSHCIPILQTACQTSQLRVVKTVRATMEEVEPLLQNDPNFRLLHLYRDPRAVYRSRREKVWTRGSYELKNGGVRSATGEVYCQTVLEDYKKRKELEKKYPGRIKSLVYDEFMLDPLRSRGKVFNFLGMPEELNEEHFDLKASLNRSTSSRNRREPNPLKTDNWQSLAPPDTVEEIEKVCQRLAEALHIKWRT